VFSPRESLSRKEEKELFREFMEDYNTATLPRSITNICSIQIKDVVFIYVHCHLFVYLLLFVYSEKYYDLDKWTAAQSRAGLNEDKYFGMSDEQKLRALKQEESLKRKQTLESARLATMVAALKEVKESRNKQSWATDAWADVERRQINSLAKPTFESIEKQRQQKKLDAEMEAKKKYK
jgi:hypothetical protein